MSFLSDFSQRDCRHVPLSDRRHQGAVLTAGTGRQAGQHAEFQLAAIVRAQVQESEGQQPRQVRLGAQTASEAAGRYLPSFGL